MAGTPIEILIKALGAEEVVSALKKVTTEGSNVKKSLTDTGASLDTLGTKSKTALANIGPQFTGATKSTNDFSSAVKNTNPVLGDFSKNFEGAAAGAPKLTTALDQTSEKSATLIERGKGLSASFQSMMASTVALTGTAIALFETWDSVSDAELAVEKSRNSLEQQTIRLHSLEATRNKLIADGKTNTEAYAIVEEKLALQHNKVEVATGDLSNAEENLAIVQTHFYKEIIPLTMSGAASMFQLFTTGKAGIVEMGKSFKGLIPAITGATKSMTAMGLVPWLLPLTIASGLIIAFTTNLFGFRDAVNGVGVAIGNAIPMLKPFLDMLGSAGEFLTNLFNGGAQEAQAFEGEFSGAMEGAGDSGTYLSKGVEGGVDDSIAALDRLIQTARTKKQELIEAFPSSVELPGGVTVEQTANPTVTTHKLSDKDAPNIGRPIIPGSQRPKFDPAIEAGGVWEDFKTELEAFDIQGQSTKDVIFDLNELTRLGTAGVILGINAEGERIMSVKNVTEAMKSLGYSQSQVITAIGLLESEYGFLISAEDVQSKSIRTLTAEDAAATGEKEKLTEASKAGVDVTAAQTIASAQNTTVMGKLNEEYNKNWAVLMSSTGAQDLYNQGAKQLQIDLMAAHIELASGTGYWESYDQALKTTTVQQSTFDQGVLKQKQALVESKVAVLQSAGAYSQLLVQMKTGEPQTIAYTQAVIDQKIALEQSKIEVYTLQGTLDTLTQQYKSGEQSIVAFNKGFIEQKTSLIETALAVDNTRGAIKALAEEIVSGNAQITAWNTGLVEGRLATMQQSVAVDEAAGSLQAYQESITSGVAEETAFNAAIWETNRAVAEAYVNLSASAGALQEYNHLIAQGIPQYNAYHQAILDVQMANAKLGETLFSNLGTYQENLKALDDTTIASQKFAMAFLEGKDAALKWGESLQNTGASASGMLRGLDEIASSFGTILPANMRLSEQGAKDMIVAFGNVPSALAEMSGAGYKAGLELTSGVADAIKEGGKEVNESLDELEDKFGVEFSDGIKAGIKSANLGKAMSETITEGLNTARVAFAGGTSKIEVESMVQGLGDRFKSSFDKLSEPMKKSAAGVMADINYELSQGPDKNAPNGIEDWISRIMVIAARLPEQIDPATNSIQGMANVDFTDSISRLNSYKSSLDSVTASLKTYNENTGGLFQNATPTNVFTSESAKQNTKGTQQVATPEAAPDTSAIDAAQAKIDTFNLNLAQLPTTITTIVNAANTSFLPLADPLLTTVSTKIITFGTTLQGFRDTLPGFAVDVNTNLLPIGDPFTTTIPAKILTFSQALALMPGFINSNVVTPIINSFNNMAAALQSGPFTKIQNDAAVAAVAVTNIFISEAKKLGTAYDTAVAAAMTKFGELQTKAAGVMGSIIQYSNDAANAVGAVVNIINSLQDKTVTITTRYETIGSPSGYATGFGPTIVDHPTRLLVGESGPEYVQVTPLASSSSKNLSPNKRLDMFADPGKKRQNTAPLFEMATGTFPFNDPSNAVNSMPNTTSSSNWVDVNIVAVGGRNVSATGNALPIYGSGSSSGGSYSGGGGSSGGGTNNNNYQSSSGGSGSGGGTSGGGSTGGSSGGGSSSGGGGLIQPDYIKIEGNSWSYKDANQDVMSWKVVPMKDDPSKFKVVDDKGRNIATNFSSKEQADAWLAYKQGNPMYEGGPIPNGGSNSGGGTGSGGTTNSTNTLGAGGEGYYKTVTGYSVPGYVVSPGHGATDPSKWSNPNIDPKSWKAVEMTSRGFQGLWKVVDDKGINIAANFKSKEEAEEFIADHIAVVEYPGGSSGGTTPGGSSPSNYSDYKTTSTGYGVPSYIQTSGGSKWNNPNLDPNTWKAVPMVTDPALWKVVDDKGVIIAANFKSQVGANEFIQEHIAAYNKTSGGFDFFDNTAGPATTSSSSSNTSGGGGRSGPPTSSSNPALSHPVSNVQQSQSISQNSNVNQGNNSNVDMQSGQNSRLRIQNGVVIEATGIYAGYGGGGGPGGSALTGSIFEPLRERYRSGQDNQFGIYDNGPVAGMFDTGLTSGMLNGGGPSGGGGGFGSDLAQYIITKTYELINNIFRSANMPAVNINMKLDGNTVYKNQVKQYNGNLSTFLS